MKKKRTCGNCQARKKRCDGLEPCSACVDYKAKARKPVPDCSYNQTQCIKKSVKKHELMKKLSQLEDELEIIKFFSASGDAKTSTEVSNSESFDDKIMILDEAISNEPLNHQQPTWASQNDENPYFVQVPTVQEDMDEHSLNEIHDQIHRNLLKTLILYSLGREDEALHTLYSSVLRGRHYGLFLEGTFTFPVKFPVIPMIPAKDVFELQIQKDLVWIMCLKLDTHQSVKYGTSFLINEPRDSHMDLPSSVCAPLKLKYSNGVTPFLYDSTMVLPASHEEFNGKSFYYSLKHIRLFRKILYLKRLPNLLHYYNQQQLHAIFLNLHWSILALYEELTPEDALFASIERFDSKESIKPTNQEKRSTRKTFGEKIRLTMLAMLHSTAIRNNILLMYPLKQSSNVSDVRYTSFDVIVHTTRAIMYVLSSEINTVSLPYEEEELEDMNNQILIFEVSGGMGIITEIVVSAIGTFENGTEEKSEFIQNIQDILYPSVNQYGWKWPMAAHFAFEIQNAVLKHNKYPTLV
ncbi:hypothetical protein BC833DRAFT_589988 [Globomyces pollinis-pini]|nr:hypothetical protein BC833DRAFT_589988 [Globomyces pollinis-pini]